MHTKSAASPFTFASDTRTEMYMADGATRDAIRVYEQARDLLEHHFESHLELGVLYLADRQFASAAASLDEVSRFHPAYPMALFKRAQASVLLEEADSEARVRKAWRYGDATTRQLMLTEKLFRGIDFRSE